MPKVSVVTTTINIPHFLKAYAEDAERFGHYVEFIVIGDKKSPAETGKFCETIPNCLYMDIPAQQEYMKRFPKLWEHLPFNSFERRMIGILQAYECGADVVVTIDDDNLLATEDALLWHQQVGQNWEIPVFRSSSEWFNVCSFLKEENGVDFYHRGYSPKNRWKDSYISSQTRDARVVVNAGLWYNNPDTDAITRLERKLNVTGFYVPDSNDSGTIGLAPGTWSPFNCQNTALAREVIPAYFMSPYVGRHSDIFASYVINRLTEHFGDVIAFGMPLANHTRDTYPHNLFHDFDIERWGMQNTDIFCDILRNIKLIAKSYHEGFGQIVKELECSGYIQGEEWIKMVKGMKIWHETFKGLIR
jgi:hypothetical protein